MLPIGEEKMKKILTIALVLMLSLSMLCAEGNKESSSSKNKLVDIELWYGAAVTEAGPIPSDWEGYQIIKDKLGINLKLVALPSSDSDQDVKIQAAGAGNTLPDVFMVSRPVLTNLVKQGLVAPLGEDFFAKMPNRTAKYHDQDSINHASFNGKNWGMSIPSSTVGVEVFAIRKDWLDNLGLEVPTTLDELYDVMYAFTYNDPDGNGKNDTYGYGAFIESNSTFKGYPGARLWPIMGAFDVPGLWDFRENHLGLTIYNPEFYNFMEFLNKMISNGVIDPNWITYKKDDFRAAWKQGKFGMMYESWAALSAESNYLPFDMNFPEGEWITINPPVGETGTAYVGALDKAYRIYAVSAKDAKNQEKMDAIARLFEWFGTDEGYYLLGYGVEGKNYVLNEKGVPTVGDLGENSFVGIKGQVMTQLRNIVYFNTSQELAGRFPDYYAKNSGKLISPIKYCIAAEEGPWKNTIGSGIMPTPNADVMRFYEQGLAEFIAGSKKLTPENWEKFISDFNKMGGKAWNDEGVAFAKQQNLVTK